MPMEAGGSSGSDLQLPALSSDDHDSGVLLCSGEAASEDIGIDAEAGWDGNDISGGASAADTAAEDEDSDSGSSVASEGLAAFFKPRRKAKGQKRGKAPCSGDGDGHQSPDNSSDQVVAADAESVAASIQS